MIYATSPNGRTFALSNGYFLHRYSTHTDIWTDETRTDFVARVGIDWMVSFQHPFPSDPAGGEISLRAAMMLLANRNAIRQLTNWKDAPHLMAIKSHLAEYDGRSESWK